ncbi:MAG: BREX-2 system phosphatase PglZ [Actinomycetota bacterium]|nr:BREX-2 system phosphatase PglZ [Actinomycetota bacterium]
MIAPALTARDVRAAVQRFWGSDRHRQRVLLLRARPDWSSADVLHVDALQVRVRTAVSSLALRELLATYPDERLVVLTDVDERDLGVDLLSQTVKQQVNAVDLWDTVQAMFGVARAGRVEASLAHDGELVAQALLTHAPPTGWPTPASGVLTRDHALRSLAAELLRAPRQLDAAGLLDWSRDPVAVLALHDLEGPLRDLLVVWMLRHTGAGTRPVLDLAAAGNGTDAVALGLVAGVMWSGAGTGRAKGRLEQVLGRTLDDQEARAWAQLSEGWVLRRLATEPHAAVQVLEDAERLLTQMDAAALVGTSPLLPGGLQERARAAASALPAAVNSPGPQSLDAMERALKRLTDHQLAPGSPTLETVTMAVRLVRWLAGNAYAPGHAMEALAWQVAEGGWVDRARQVVANGVSDPVLGTHLAVVHAAARERRASIDVGAAKLVAQAVASDEPFGSLVPVEHALRTLVVPLAASAPVLLLVLDGMSAAVANEVVESALGLGWVEHQQGSSGVRDMLMAGLPTVTEVSRTSLLSGRLQRGGQREERRGVAEVLGDRAALFHLRDLQARPGQDLPDDVRDAVQDTTRPVVAAVLNAVDDSLSGGDPARTRWTVSQVRHLAELLGRARAAGRVVVLTSDHGHVVDQGVDGEVRYNREGGGLRWRPYDGVVGDDEVRLAGPRVVLGGGDVVAAVKETLRYKQRHEGYHGGAALAEMAIPFVVLTRRGDSIAGYVPSESAAPEWWSGPLPVDWSDPDGSETLFGLFS